jgi:hypothetical protein
LDVRKTLFAALLGSAEALTGVAVVAAIVIGALYVGRELFVPIALAILLSFVLAPSPGHSSVGRFLVDCPWSSSFC